MTYEYPQYEHDRAAQATDFLRFVTETGINTYLGSEEDRINFINSLTPEAFTDLLVQVHENVTGRPHHDAILAEIPMIIEPDEAHPVAFMLPASEDKQLLLEHILETAQAVTAPALKSLVIGYGINVAHPFHDGNGRTARAMYYLLSRDFNPTNADDWRAIIGSNGDELMPLNASIFTELIESEMARRSPAYTLSPNGEPVPKLRAAVSDPAIRLNPHQLLDELSQLPTLRREFDPDRESLTLNILNQTMLGCTVPYHLVNDYHSRAARDASVRGVNGQNYMLIDQFLRNANDRDLDTIYKIYRENQLTFAKQLISTIAFKENQMLAMGVRTAELGEVVDTVPQIAYGFTERIFTFDMAAYGQTS